MGLNLAEADYASCWRNPATETQAADRAHRIGQTRNVMFYRLVAWDTIEEKVRALKARLFSTVLDDGNAFGTTLPVDGIRPARLTARLLPRAFRARAGGRGRCGSDPPLCGV